MVSCAECTSSSGGFIIAAVSVASFYTFFRKEGKVSKTKNQKTHILSRIAIWTLLSNVQSSFTSKKLSVTNILQLLATLISANCCMVPKRVLIRECKHWQHDCPSPLQLEWIGLKSRIYASVTLITRGLDRY